MRRLVPEPALDIDPGTDATTALAAEYAYPRGPRDPHGGAGDGAWLRANFVSSADGAAAFEGRSRGLSNEPDKQLFRLLRGLADVVIAGAGTARVEGYRAAEAQPDFAAMRAAAGQRPAPVLCIVSGSLDLDFASPLFIGADPRTIVVTTELADPARLAAARTAADVVIAGRAAIDFPAAVAALRERGYRRLLCEGGPTLMHHLVAHGLVDEMCLTISPLLTGGAAPRVLDGPVLEPPTPMQLAGLLEQDGVLFARYLLHPPGKG